MVDVASRRYERLMPAAVMSRIAAVSRRAAESRHDLLADAVRKDDDGHGQWEEISRKSAVYDAASHDISGRRTMSRFIDAE